MGDRFDTVLRFPGPSARANVQIDIPGGPIMTDLLPPQAGHMPTGNPKADAKAAKAYAKATRPWFKKKRWWLAGAVIVAIGATATSGGGSGVETTQDNSPSQSTEVGNKKVAASKEKSAPAEPQMTSGQENALQAGQNYIDTMPFSQKGLIQQLSSPAGDDYSLADATFAANHVEADWNAEAVEAAENYLDMMPFSHNGLVQQLSSSAGDKFTPAQAQYAANKVL